MIYKSSRKIQNYGSSLALTLPSFYVKVNEIKKGKKIFVFYEKEGILILADCEELNELRECVKLFLDKLEE